MLPVASAQMQSDILTLRPAILRPRRYAGLQHEEFMMAETSRRCRTQVIGILACLALVAGGVIASATAQDAPTPDYQAIVASPDRSDADRQADKRREPVKMLGFTGVKTGMKVLDMEAGAGYRTERHWI